MSYFELFQESPGLFFLVLVISLILTLFVYGAFPIIFSKTRKKPITKKKYKTLCYCVNIIGIVFFVAFNGSAVSGGPYLLWTWIFSSRGVKTLEAKGLLSDTAETEDAVVATNENKDMYGATASIAEPEGSALAEKKPSTITVNPTIDNQKAPTAKRYCSYCGSLVDEETKTCTGCGKQYFKGIKHVLGKIFCKKHLALVIVSFLLLASLIANIVLSVRVADLDRAYQINRDKVVNYEDLVVDYIKEIWSLKSDLNFYDKHVVFVSDDGTNLYHKLNCSKYDRSRYWAFNIEAAISKGYRACSSCCD